MEYIRFIEYFKNQVLYEAEEKAIPYREAFINTTIEMLSDAEIISDFVPLHFEGNGRQNKKIQIDGYYIDDVDSTLSLIVLYPLSNFSEETLTSQEVTKYLDRATAFLRDSDYIVNVIEESAPAYGLAADFTRQKGLYSKFRVILLTDQKRSKNLDIIGDSSLFGISIEYQIWDIERLHKLAESESTREDIEIDVTEFGDFGIPCISAVVSDDFQAYLCNVPGIILAEIFNKYGSRLLEGNVRSFIQTKGKVNKGIRNTILNDPNKFFIYNNGIAATVNSIEIEQRNGISFITRMKDLQIVNGGQTTASLGVALLNDTKEHSREKIKMISVPMKLSIVSHEKSSELIPMISRFANTQNKVSDSDLASNHPFHIRMEEASRRITTPNIDGTIQFGTKWYYERANGQYKQETYKAKESDRKKFEMSNPKKQLFKKVDLAKYVNLYHQLPHIVSQGNQKSFLKFSDWMAQEWDKSDLQFNEDYFKKIVSLAILVNETDKIVREQDWYQGSYKANIVAYTIAKIFSIIDKEYKEYAFDFKSVWQKQGISDNWKNQIRSISKIIYEHLIKSDRQVENVTEWAKRTDCWNQAVELKIRLTEETKNELVFKSQERQAEKDAKKDQKLVNEINSTVQVYEYGVENWKYAISWASERGLLNPRDTDLLKVAVAIEKGRIPSDKQSKVILEILEKLRLEGYPK
jgi:hypothetical protein